MEEKARQETPGKGLIFGLSARLLLLTVAFVMLAEVLIYVPSIANFRRNWLNDRLAAAQTAAIVFEAAPEGMIPGGLPERLLNAIGAKAMAVKVAGRRQIIAIDNMQIDIARTVDLREAGALTLIQDAFTTLLALDPTPIRVVGEGMDRAEFVEIVLDEAPLRAAMLGFSRNILLLSLLISGISAGLVYLALHLLIVRPVRRVAERVTAFEANPDDPEQVVAPSDRSDEIGIAERAIARMQRSLSGELRQKKHLAALGLAVSKINHDLRNMLAAAQLISDRLSQLPDPTVQRFAPRLIATLDRAIGFCQATLVYGRAAEPAPQRRRQQVEPLVEDMAISLGLDEPDAPVRLERQIEPGLQIDADADQMARVLLNLGRNAVQALTQAGAVAGASPTLTIRAERQRTSTRIVVADNGPGIPAMARDKLFEAFQGSSRPGGTGLGLAIAAEIVRQHAGTITLDDGPGGATFTIVIPDRNGA